MMKMLKGLVALIGGSLLLVGAVHTATTLPNPSEIPAQLRDAAAEFEELEAERNSLIVQVDELTIENSALEAQIVALEQRIAELEAQLPSPTPTVPPCSGTQVAAGSGLVAAAASAPAGTTFCLAPGVHTVAETIQLQEDDVLQGPPCVQAADLTVACTAHVTWNGPNTEQSMFRGEGFFTVQDLEISGATGNSTCNPDCGRGFKPNQGADFFRIDCHDNDNQCIGAGGKHVRVFDSELYENGTNPAFQDDARSSAGIKRVRGASLEVHDSYIHDNGWVNVWCDFCEDTYLVEGSIIENAGKNGLSWEVSGGWNGIDHAIITGNTIIGNNVTGNNTGAGITCNSCADLTVTGNTFSGNVVAVRFIDGRRGPWGPLANILVSDNDLGGDTIVGCGFAGVTCTNNTP